MVKIGIIGTGHLGGLHTKILKEVSNCEIVGVFDKDFEKSSEIGKQYSVKVYEEVEDLIKNSDALSIVTSTSAHYKMAKYALEQHKHVFIEKPITTEIHEATELVDIASRSNLKIQVGHIERFNPALVSLDKYEINPKFIQTDRLSQFNPRGTDVAVVLDLMIHDIDIILSLIRSEVREIHASGVSVVSDFVDIANARIEFENGAIANVTASRISQKKMRKMRMFQRDAYISLDFITGVSEVYRLAGPETPKDNHFINLGNIGVGDKSKSVIYEQPEIKEINALQHELQLFINCIIENTTPVVSGLDGLRALRVAEIILNKIKESQLNEN